MRKFKSLLMVTAMLILAVSCGKKFEITLSPTEYEFAPEGGEMTVEITTDGDWNLDKCPEWITASAASGSKSASVVLTAQANAGTAMREAILEVATSTNSAQLKLMQGFSTEEFIRITPADIAADYQGGEFELQIESNCNWNLSEASQQISWITVNPTSGQGTQTVKVSVAQYDQESDTTFRTATLVFSGANTLVPVNVTQTDGSEVDVVIEPRMIHFAAEGGSQQIDVTCPSTWHVSASVPWLTVSATEGSGNGQITVTAESNEIYHERLGAVSFISDAQHVTTLPVVQDAAINPNYLNVSLLEIDFSKQGGSAEITIGCNETWKLDCPDSWLSFTPYMGEGDGSFELVAEPNILDSPRNTVVNVVSDHFYRQINVTQEKGDEAPSVSLSVDTLFVDADEAVFDVDVFSNVSWTVWGSGWAEPIQGSGEGNGSFQLRVHANHEMTPRTCTIRVVASGVSASLVIVQSGYVYTLETSVTEINATADLTKVEVAVSANQNWIVSKGASWIHYEPDSGANDGYFAIVVDPNTFPRDRSAEVFVTGEMDGLIIITVNQQHAK